MKQILIIASAILLAAGCGMLGRTPEEENRIAELVQQKLDARAFKIDINYMMPQKGPSKTITDRYSLSIDGDTIDSHLPYVGVVYSVPYGGGKVLTFKDEIDAYADHGFQEDSRRIVLSTNNDEDTLIYTITVFRNGNATVNVHCRNREDISYRGTLNTDEE